MHSEADLIRKAQEGSEEAFCRLLLDHQAHVRAYLGRFIRSVDVIDDLGQETFLAAWRTLSNFKGTSSLRLWLLGIARNKALMHLREEGRRRARESRSLEVAVGSWQLERIESTAPSDTEQNRRVSALDRCIKSLPRNSADMVTDFYLKGKSAGEIAARMGKNVNAVWVALLRIRQALRKCIKTNLQAAGANS